MAQIKRIVLVNLFLVLFLTLAINQAHCNSCFSNVTGHWYSMNSTTQTWSDSNDAAGAAGGYLASITSGAENKWISDTYGAKHNGSYYYFGGNDRGAEGDWQWANGETWIYDNWKSGEPNNNGGNEDALTWYHEGFSNSDGFLWNDRDPDQHYASLIEYDTSIHFNNANGHWYSMNPIRNTWSDAKDAAGLAGGHLATITNGAENKWISDIFGIHFNGDYYYFGGNDRDVEGNWQWANGEGWGYENWQNGEPNNRYGNEDALTWYHAGFSNSDGFLWNDRDASQLRYSLVEWETNPVVPEPSTYLLCLLGLVGIVGVRKRCS